MEKQDVNSMTSFTETHKLVAPVGKFLVQRGLDTGCIRVNPELQQTANKALNDVDKNTDLKTLNQILERDLYSRFGDVYPKVCLFGVAAYINKDVSISNDETRRKLKSTQKAIVSAIGSVSGVPVLKSTASITNEKSSASNQQANSSSSNYSWRFLGAVPNISTTNNVDLNEISKHRCDPGWWGLIEVESWGRIVDLLDEECQAKIKAVTDQYPDFYWRYGLSPGEQSYHLTSCSPSGDKLLLTRGLVPQYKVDVLVKKSLLGKNDPEINVEKLKDENYVMAMNINQDQPVNRPHKTGMQLSNDVKQHIKRYENILPDASVLQSPDNHRWIFIHNPEWTGTYRNLVALKNYATGLYLTMKPDPPHWPLLEPIEGDFKETQLFVVSIGKSTGSITLKCQDKHLKITTESFYSGPRCLSSKSKSVLQCQGILKSYSVDVKEWPIFNTRKLEFKSHLARERCVEWIVEQGKDSNGTMDRDHITWTDINLGLRFVRKVQRQVQGKD